MADIINQAPLSQDTIRRIINAWHNPDELEEISDALSEGNIQT